MLGRNTKKRRGTNFVPRRLSSQGLGLGQLWGDTGALVLRQDVDAALVAFRTGPFLIQEGVYDFQCLLLGVHAATNADELGIVVLAGKAGGLGGPGQCTPGSLDLIGCNLLAIAGAAKHNAQGTRIIDGALCRFDAKGRVVILGIVGMGAAVNDFVCLLYTSPSPRDS